MTKSSLIVPSARSVLRDARNAAVPAARSSVLLVETAHLDGSPSDENWSQQERRRRERQGERAQQSDCCCRSSAARSWVGRSPGGISRVLACIAKLANKLCGFAKSPRAFFVVNFTDWTVSDYLRANTATSALKVALWESTNSTVPDWENPVRRRLTAQHGLAALSGMLNNASARHRHRRTPSAVKHTDAASARPWLRARPAL